MGEQEKAIRLALAKDRLAMLESRKSRLAELYNQGGLSIEGWESCLYDVKECETEVALLKIGVIP